MSIASLWVDVGARVGAFQLAMAAVDKEITRFDKNNSEAMSRGDKLARYASAGALVLAGTMATVAVKATKMAADFQSSQERLVSSAGESRNNLEMVSKGILDMASQVGYSAQELSTGMYTVESAGYHGADGLKVMKAAAQGAKLENADLGTVSNALTDILKDFHVPASQAATVMSQMVTATSRGKTTFEDFSGAFSAVMPLAASAKLSFADVAGSLAEMTNHGESAQQAAQNMAFAIRELMSPTKPMINAMGELNISAHDVSAQLSQRGLAGTMQYLSEVVFQHMGPAGEKLKSVFEQSTIYGKDAGLMFKSLSGGAADLATRYEHGQVALGAWRKQVAALPGPMAAAANQWKTMYDKSQTFNQTLKSGGDVQKTYTSMMAKVTGGSAALNTALMLTGENAGEVNATIKAVSKSHADAAGNVLHFSDVQKTLNFQLKSVESALSSLMIELGTDLLPIVTAAIKKIAEMAQWAEKNKSTVEMWAKILGITLIAAFIAVNAAIIGLIAGIGLIVTAVVVVATHWSTFVNDLKYGARTIWDDVSGTFKHIYFVMTDFGGKARGWGINFGNWLTTLFTNIGGWIRNGAINWGRAAANGLANFGSLAWGSIALGVQWIFDQFGSVDSGFQTVGWNIVMGVMNGINNARGDLMNFISGLAHDLPSWMQKFLGIHSPSRVFAEQVGQWIPKGIAAGIDEHAHTVHSSINALTAGYSMAGVNVNGLGGIPGGQANTGVNVQVVMSGELKANGRDLIAVIQPEAIKYQRRNGAPAFSL